MERRHNPLGLTIETRDGKSILTGYAAVFYRAGDAGTEFRLFPDLAERVMPGAFDRAVREDDVRALFNHDANQVLGRKAAGTLRLSIDQRGLKYEIDPPESASHVVQAIQRGDVTGSSFAFRPERVAWVESDKMTVRELHDVRLFDVGPVVFPAYAGATAGVRSEDADALQAEAAAWRAERQRAGLAARLASVRARAVEVG